MQRRHILLALSLSIGLSACQSTTSVELFQLNDNGKVVNIGRSGKNGQMIYGHFATKDRYDRAWVETAETKGTSDILANVCHINTSPLGGIRLEPCTQVHLLNEGPLLSDFDTLGIYYTAKAPWATYILYQYLDGQWSSLLERQIFDEHWAGGINVIRRDPEAPDYIFVTSSHREADSTIVLKTERIRLDALPSLGLLPAIDDGSPEVTGIPAQPILQDENDAQEPGEDETQEQPAAEDETPVDAQNETLAQPAAENEAQAE